MAVGFANSCVSLTPLIVWHAKQNGGIEFMETKNIMIVGVGGQGTLLTSRFMWIIKAGGFV